MSKISQRGGSRDRIKIQLYGGEGITGTTIKDTWTKSRGRVEVGEGGGFGWGGVEGWGEKAHNCN